MHVGFPDPAKATGTEEEILTAFRRVRDALRDELISLLQRKAQAKSIF
jgi:arsenate reductase